MADSFNLITAEWIPVLRLNGKFERLGIRRVLLEAHEIRQIAASNPMDNVAITRFLLAILYWCKGSYSEKQDSERLLQTEHFPCDWFSKFDEKQENFELFGDRIRFYQVPGARRRRASTDLLQEIPTGNNFWHFKHSTDYKEGLCLPCCALGLLRLPMFSVSGLPDLKAGINGTPPIYVVPIGRTLLHTLCANWVTRQLLGTPSWEDSSNRPQDGQPVPVLVGLTLLSRRVWLHGPIEPGGLCVGCGSEQATLVRTCEYQSAGDQQNEDWEDPHVVYVARKKGERRGMTTPDLSKSFFKMDKPWAALFKEIASSATQGPAANGIALLIVGFATDKAKNIDVWERICIVGAEASNVTEKFSLWNDEGGKLSFRMKPKGSKSRGVEFAAAVTAIRPHVESQVSSQVSQLVAHPDQAWPQAVAEYREMMAILATSLAPGFTTRALQRQAQIAQAVPEITTNQKPKASKAKVKKGGAK